MDAQVANGGSWRTVSIAMSIVTAPIVPSQKSMSEDPENGNNDLLRIFAQPSHKSHFLRKQKKNSLFLTSILSSYNHQVLSLVVTQRLLPLEMTSIPTSLPLRRLN